MAAGFRTAAAVPMRLRRETAGAQTLVNTEPVGVDADSIQLGQALADQATVGILHHQAVHRTETLSEQLQAALHHRVVIEQAKGVVAEACNLTLPQAFTLLRDYAHTNGHRLTDLVRSIADRTIRPTHLTATHAPTSHT